MSPTTSKTDGGHNLNGLPYVDHQNPVYFKALYNL